MKKHKTCNRCRAYEYKVVGQIVSGGIEYICSLHYRQVQGRPEEPCPKPLTIVNFVKILSASANHENK